MQPPVNVQQATTVASTFGGVLLGLATAFAIIFAPTKQIETVSFIGLCIGMMFWKFAPTMIALLTWAAAKWGQAQGAKV